MCIRNTWNLAHWATRLVLNQLNKQVLAVEVLIVAPGTNTSCNC